MKLPAQAIRGRLANIKPCKKRWEQSAADRLLGLVSNKPLIGLVTHVDKVMWVHSSVNCCGILFFVGRIDHPVHFTGFPHRLKTYKWESIFH